MNDAILRYDAEAKTIRLTQRGLEHPWKVLVLGAGGTGSEMMDALARLDYALEHLGHPGFTVVLQDADVVSPANVGRQRFLPSDVGQPKAKVLADRYGQLLGMSVAPRLSMMEPKTFGELKAFDLVLTCVDRASVRVQIYDFFRDQKSEVVWGDLGNGQFDGQACLGHLGIPAGCRLPNVLDLRPSIRFTKDDDQPSCSVAEALKSQMIFVNRWMADAMTSMLVQLLTQGELRNNGAFVDMRTLRVSPLSADETAWSMISPGYLDRPVKRRSGSRNRRVSQEVA